MRIALFVTCLGETLFPEVAKATVSIIESLGHEVDVPARQSCCGQMHINSGYREIGAQLARRFSDVFEPYEAVVAPSASCVGTVRELYPQLGLAGKLGERVFELSEFLVKELRVNDLGAYFPHRVVYHPTCHSLRVTRLGDAPLTLLSRVRGLEVVELSRADECCGFGGTFAVKNPETSAAIVSDKCFAIESSGAEYCVSVDSSCLLQIGGGLSRRGAGVRPIHLAEVLACR